jgi:Na+/H+ antiporter NhaA
LVGIELKREILEGELSNIRKIVLPSLGAVGGMVGPAAIYIILNIDDPIALKGWAIPAATDIAFALGLFIGKQLGVFSFCWIGIKLHFAELPKDLSWASLYGTGALCGIGFTMSLFIASLAFEETGVNLLFDERLGIILGSLASGILGYSILA